jgi:peptidoglycan/xylan/chitin deacetylase (PgdA/CDA1 family)
MGRAREIAEGTASVPDPLEPGLAIGYPRLLALLDDLAVHASFFVEGWNALHHPDRVRELAERGHEVALHGWVHENFGALDRRRTEQLLHDGTAALRRLGLPVEGFRAPGGIRGAHTVEILGALGYRYDSSTESRHDDELATGDHGGIVEPALLAPGLVHVPWRYSMVDSVQYLRRPGGPIAPAELATCWRTAIDRAASTGATVTLVAHAYVSGVDDARFEALRSVLEHACLRGDVEVVTAGQIANRFLASAALEALSP